MKKAISVLLLLFFLLITACTEEQSDLASFIDPDTADDLDFNGYVCTVNYWHNITYADNSIFWYHDGTVYADAARKRIKDIEENYNCEVIIESHNDTEDMAKIIMANFASGAAGFDITAVESNTNTKNLCSVGLLLPMEDFAGIIDYENDELYGPVGFQEAAMYKGKVYMVHAYSHPMNQIMVGQVLLYNETLSKQYNCPDFRALNEQKAWTWDAFEDFMEYTASLNGEKKIYGVASDIGIFSYLALVNNGYSLAVSDGNGGWTSGANAPNVIESIDWLKKIYSLYGDYIYKAEWIDAIEYVSTGNAFMCISQPGDIVSTAAYKVESFGIIPFPYGPSIEYGTAVNNTGVNGIGVNVTSAEPDIAVRVIAEYCQPFDEYPTLDDVMSIYDSVFFDKRDLQVLINMAKYGRFSYYPYDGMAFSYAIGNSFLSESASEIVSGNSHLADEVVTEYVIPNMDYITYRQNKSSD